jgi:DNA (cytosine-5)-methyltransferase 1
VSAPLVVDFFCCAGGASAGYAAAGFDVVGVERAPVDGRDPAVDYPFPLHVGDAVQVMDRLLAGGAVRFGHRDVTLADCAAWVGSPPCHDHSDLAALVGEDGSAELLEQTRARFVASGLPYVIENVEGAPLVAPLLLCGSEFDLWAACRDGRRRQLRRHRLFESNVFLMGAGGCHHRGQPVGVYGTGGGGQMTRGYKGHPEEVRAALGIDWTADRWALSQAIPPRFTQHIGEQLLAAITQERAA